MQNDVTVSMFQIIKSVALALAFSLLSFLLLAWTLVIAVVATMEGVDENTIINQLTGWMNLFISEGLSMPSLKILGAYGYAVVPILGGDPSIALAVGILTYIIGFIITIALFKALKNTKESTGNFVWFILLSLLDLVVTFLMWGVPFGNGIILLDGIYWYFMQILTFIVSIRAMVCASYLNTNFEEGASIKKRDLKRMYNESKYQDYMEV